jgi:hypothetical protein
MRVNSLNFNPSSTSTATVKWINLLMRFSPFDSKIFAKKGLVPTITELFIKKPTKLITALTDTFSQQHVAFEIAESTGKVVLVVYFI